VASFECNCPCHEIATTPELPADLPAIDLSTPYWHALAACADPTVPEVFYSEAGGRDGEEVAELPTYGRAQRVCARCPVRRPCLAAALRIEGTGLGFGVWGGIPPKVRRAHRDLPLEEALDTLEAWFRTTATRWLTPKEEVV